MIYSMTGYGKASSESVKKKVLIEIKALNSKQLDLAMRMPSVFREKEIEIRNLIAEKLIRGKIDFTITVENAEATATSYINP